MAKANFVKAAQKDIYRNGNHVQYESTKGKRAGQMKTKLDRTVPRDESDTILIAKGESYYWWQFKNGGKNISKDRPKGSQLTQSNYLSQYYAIQEDIAELSASDISDLEDMIDEIKGRVEELKDETESSLDAIPESLKYAPVGELLQERIDALENVISEIESIDLDYDEPDEDDLRDELKDDVEYSPTEEEEEDDDFDIDEKKKELVSEGYIDDLREEKMQNFVDEKIEEMQGISFD